MFITLNNGLNREYLRKNNTRAWSFEKWEELSRRIKETYNNVLTVQIGNRMRKEDDISADINLNGMTDLEQVAILLKNAVVHVDYDGGLVHLRHLYGGKSIVLMGPSNVCNHRYPENEYIQTNICTPCEWQTADWLSVCPKGNDESICMSSITVDMVMEKIAIILPNNQS